MDAEKNVVEAARKLLKLIQPNAVGGFDVTGNLHDELRELMGAIAAYDSAPAPSEDRVREAAKAARVALFNCFNRSPESQEWLVADAIREYVTPAPALPEGTVAVEVSLLKRWRVAMSRCIATNGSPTHNLSLPEIDARLPPPPAPEPSAELVAEWTRRGEEYAITYPFSDGWGELERDPVIHAVRDTLRAEWAKKGGG